MGSSLSEGPFLEEIRQLYGLEASNPEILRPSNRVQITYNIYITLHYMLGSPVGP